MLMLCLWCWGRNSAPCAAMWLWLPRPAHQHAPRSRIITKDFWLCKNIFAGSFSPSPCYVTNQACWETLLSWRSLPEPQVFHDSFSKPSGNLNRCFCEAMMLLFDSSGANKNGEVKLRLAAAASCLASSGMEVIKSEF